MVRAPLERGDCVARLAVWALFVETASARRLSLDKQAVMGIDIFKARAIVVPFGLVRGPSMPARCMFNTAFVCVPDRLLLARRACTGAA